MTNLIPRYESILASSLTGTDGATSRTYTLKYGNVASATILIYVQAGVLTDSDYTFSGGIVTFVNQVWNDQKVEFRYSTTDSTPSGSLKYATTLQLAAVLGIKNDIPSWDDATTPVKETVGVGDNSNTVFYLDHKNVIDNSFTLYYGSSESTSTTLTNVTHYNLDLSSGKITITAAGLIVLGVNSIYAEYSYVMNGMSDEYLTSVLLRAENQVEDECETHFTNGSSTNPDYPHLDEVQSTKGQRNLKYFTNEGPLIDIKTALDGDITTISTSLNVTAGDGAKLPITGKIVIGTEIISYTNISSDTLQNLTRGVDNSTIAAHTDGDEIHTTIIQISGTDEGTTPTWYVRSWNDETFADENGKIYIYDRSLISDVTGENMMLPQQDVENRFKISYYHGYDFIPADITRLTIIFAKRMLMNDTMSKSIMSGRNEFRPEIFNADETEINRIIAEYFVARISNT
jgi:hypothetical protein